MKLFLNSQGALVRVEEIILDFMTLPASVLCSKFLRQRSN